MRLTLQFNATAFHIESIFVTFLSITDCQYDIFSGNKFRALAREAVLPEPVEIEYSPQTRILFIYVTAYQFIR